MLLLRQPRLSHNLAWRLFVLQWVFALSSPANKVERMLTLNLLCRDARCGTLRNLRGVIALAVSHGVTSDYWVSLFDTRHRPMHRAVLRTYPRWTEPLRAFLARSLDAALPASVASNAFSSDACELTVTDWSTQRVLDSITIGDLQPASPGGGTVGAASGWHLVRWACAQHAFASQEVPANPPPIRLTTYAASGVQYCRTSELPVEARVAFEKLHGSRDRPLVTGIPDAVYPWWPELFLRDELRQFGGAAAVRSDPPRAN